MQQMTAIGNDNNYNKDTTATHSRTTTAMITMITTATNGNDKCQLVMSVSRRKMALARNLLGDLEKAG